MKFSNIYKRYELRSVDVHKYIDKNGYTPSILALYSATCGIPVHVLHYMSYKYLNKPEALDYCKEVCQFYRVEFDLID